MLESDVLIVGGGAAGLCAAVAAARVGASVALIEQNDRVGKTILATGNGRCNLSNTNIEKGEGAAYYRHCAFVTPTLVRYECETLRTFFAELGLLTIADERGWLFPRTRWAHSVLAVLLNELRRRKVALYTNHAAREIAFPSGSAPFTVTTTEGSFSATALVLACGVTTLLRQAFPQDNDLALLRSPQPVLGPLKTETAPIKGLDGIRANCRVRLLREDETLAEEDGEVLFRSYGVSGIVIFNLSRFAQAGHVLSLDFFPEFSCDELKYLLVERRRRQPETSVSEFFDGLLHPRLAQALWRQGAWEAKGGIADGASPVLAELADVLKDYRLGVIGGPNASQAQITRGGLAIEAFDPYTLRSRVQPRLFAAGECLDVDGPCGGFNLHWAWASGLIAGEMAATCPAGIDARVKE
jgi:predicted Rossmann fold flavoprotein